MAKTLKYGKGKSSIEIEGTQRELIMTLIKQAEPILIDVLEDTVENLSKQSEQAWLVRQPKYGKSKGSKFQHSTGLRIIPPYTIEAFVRNNAEYAWAIKVGRQSETNIRQGKRLADVVLWQPAKAEAQKVVQKVALEVVKKLRAVK